MQAVPLPVFNHNHNHNHNNHKTITLYPALYSTEWLNVPPNCNICLTSCSVVSMRAQILICYHVMLGIT